MSQSKAFCHIYSLLCGYYREYLSVWGLWQLRDMIGRKNLCIWPSQGLLITNLQMLPYVILVADFNRIWGSRGEHLNEKHSILQALTKGMVLFKIKKTVLWIVDTLVSLRKNIYSWQVINWNLVYRVNVGLFVYIFILSKIITKRLFNLEWTTKTLIPLPVSLDISGEPSTLLLYWEFLFQFYLTSVLVR